MLKHTYPHTYHHIPTHTPTILEKIIRFKKKIENPKREYKKTVKKKLCGSRKNSETAAIRIYPFYEQTCSVTNLFCMYNFRYLGAKSYAYIICSGQGS
jgi:hypothetical protein